MEQDYKEKSRLWKVLDRTYLYRDAWLTARKDRVQLPNGNIIPSYYILEYPNWVNTIAITKDRKFIFVRQYRHGIEEVRYELCAGVCDKEDASPLESARRELWEETGYGNGHWSPFMVMSANPSTMNNLTYTFLATDVEPISAPHQEPFYSFAYAGRSTRFVAYGSDSSVTTCGCIMEIYVPEFISRCVNKGNR